ncbi:MAG: hypothetical protein ABWY78_08105 [Microvirga sp.]
MNVCADTVTNTSTILVTGALVIKAREFVNERPLEVETLELGAVGSGIALHVKDKARSSDLAGVNRDTVNTGVVIKNESVGVKVYASDTSIKAVAEGVQVVGRALGRPPGHHAPARREG